MITAVDVPQQNQLVVAQTANRNLLYKGGALAVSPSAPASLVVRAHIWELYVATDLLFKGFAVYRPLTPRAPCDLVIVKGTTTLRVEVTKGYRRKSDNMLKWSQHDPKNYDLLAIYEIDSTDITYIPAI